MNQESPMVTAEKQVMVVGFDDKEDSTYALQWTLAHFFTPSASNAPFRLVIVYAKPSPPSATVPEAAEILRSTEVDMKKIAARVAKITEEICGSELANNAVVEVMQGDPRDVLCDTAKKHQASMLVVGSHGYGAIKRAVLGSVSDYCAHHAQCTVMIVKKPKTKH